MNGRIYDPVIGRFMSADPHIQSPGNLQSYNRYAYVLNNPLMYTDPSGYWGFDLGFISWHPSSNPIAVAAAIVVAIYAPEFLATNPSWGLATISSDGMVALTASGGALVGGAAGLIASGGDMRAGLSGAISGGMFAWAGGIGEASSFERYAAHGVAGCVSGEVGGGGCARGAASAVAGKYATNELAANPVAAIVAGGTASALGGGKFANGAVTSAFGYLFNYLSHSQAAGPYVERLRAGSGQAGAMLDAMAADPNTNYYIDVGPVPESAGGGTTRIQQPSLSLWDRLLGRSASSATVIMTVDVSSQVQFTDVGGQSFRPSAERIMAHELGHGYTYLQGGYMGYRTNYDAAIRYENQISRQMNSGAPLRALSDHGRGP